MTFDGATEKVQGHPTIAVCDSETQSEALNTLTSKGLLYLIRVSFHCMHASLVKCVSLVNIVSVGRSAVGLGRRQTYCNKLRISHVNRSALHK